MQTTTAASLREFTCDDLLRYSRVNLDPLTETFNSPFYLGYLARWPEYCATATRLSDSHVIGYVFGKAEGRNQSWHGHVTAVTVAPEYRRQGLAKKLMDLLEDVTIHVHNAFFVDLFVRVSNELAINMYRKFGYIVYRRVLDYYSGEEDAFDMRKAMPRDTEGTSVKPAQRAVRPEEIEFN